MKRVITLLAGLTLFFALAFAPGFPWSASSFRKLNRLVSKIETRLAQLRGHQPRLISLTGRLIVNGAAGQTLMGARVIATESTSGYSAMSDSEGRFVLPHLMWYPGASYNLLISADAHHLKRLRVEVPSSCSNDSIVDVGELRIDSGYDVDHEAFLVRPMQYDVNNREYYTALFARLTQNHETDGGAVDAVSKYVSEKLNYDERQRDFKTPRQILERGSCFCSNLALAMAAITAAGSYPTRTVHLSDSPDYQNTHVVVEVYYGDQWHLYDPTYGVFFLNRHNEVASYNELRLDPNLVTRDAFARIKPETTESILAWMPKAYRAGFHQIYEVSNSETCQ